MWKMYVGGTLIDFLIDKIPVNKLFDKSRDRL